MGRGVDNPEIPNADDRKQLKKLYFDFLRGLKDFMPEFLRDECLELLIGEIPIKGKVKLFDGYTQGQATIKNQGKFPCYLSTTGMGGYKLDPGEVRKFFVNSQVIVTTLSGTTILGFIRT